MTAALGEARARASGKYLFVGDRKLHVRGVTYGTFRPGRFGVPFPEPAVVRSDFRLMAEAGFNAVRTYTVPPTWLLDQALDQGLHVMVGIPWEQHVAFLEEGRRAHAIEAKVRAGVVQCEGHPAVLAYAVGNEIPAAIVRWSGRRRIERHIRRLYEAAKGVDPDALVTYANFPSTEYLDLPFLDFLAYNVYLESTPRLSAYIARLQNQAGDRPLVMAELGMDSARNGVMQQARVLREQVEASAKGGCAGSFVFSWTDEWHRGGQDVEDWEFGLTTRTRRLKPAYVALEEAFAGPPKPHGGGWPSVTVVVCAYDGARTIGHCLRGLEGLDYPDYEVVVVDDGSRDGTAAIASLFDVRLIRTENRGLSRARNTGIEAATGEIVAFIDCDATPDPDWLIHLARAFASEGVAGAGGPNIAPAGDGLVAACVANAPGGPVHVLRDDREAEHVPGCNMAFLREALLDIGGFDPRFRVAGDDVDICWRIQERGGSIAFVPGAVVWHHARDSVGAYWRQQRGYGVAEALLEAKWPEKYNVAGHVTWGGRVYGPGAHVFPLWRSRIYGGTWGNAPFQTLESPSPGVLWQAAAMPEWYLALAVLLVLSLLSGLWSPLVLAVPLLGLGIAMTLVRAGVGAARARFPGERLGPRELLRHRALTALLHLIQPMARLHGRFLSGLVPWRVRARSDGFKWPWPSRISLWREVGEARTTTLERLERDLVAAGFVVRRGGGYDDWDLVVEGGSLGRTLMRSCVEWHGGAKQLLRFAATPLPTGVGSALLLGVGGLAVWAWSDGAGAAAAALAALAALIAGRAIRECGTSLAAMLASIRVTVEAAVELDTGSGAGREKEDSRRDAAKWATRPLGESRAASSDRVRATG